MGPLHDQLEELRRRFGEVEVEVLASGNRLMTVQTVPLPQGWTKRATSIRFLVPPAYPMAPLDCFWADQDLLLEGNRTPQNAQSGHPIPETGHLGLWFSWHLQQQWNPNRDSLSSWMNTITDRLRRLQ